ncbi:MAG: hypothetical protein ABIJ18_02840 [archaeon]
MAWFKRKKKYPQQDFPAGTSMETARRMEHMSFQILELEQWLNRRLPKLLEQYKWIHNKPIPKRNTRAYRDFRAYSLDLMSEIEKFDRFVVSLMIMENFSTIQKQLTKVKKEIQPKLNELQQFKKFIDDEVQPLITQHRIVYDNQEPVPYDKREKQVA